MSNASATFHSKGTRIFHGTASGAIAACRFLYRVATTGALAACTTGVKPVGVAPATYADGDAVDYHRGGIAAVETDGSAAVGDTVKAAADGSGKAIKDAAPGYATAGVLLTLDTTSNIGDVELNF